MHYRWILLALTACAQAQDAFILLEDGHATSENQARVEERFSPCSTFKIPNSLIALETGVVSDAAFTLAYDPRRDGERYGAWSRDHDLRSAIRNSVVWYYQEVARRIGPDRMKEWVGRLQYGNMATTPDVDRFWLGQDLRISASEQAGFLRRFYKNELPVSGRSAGIVKDILLLESTPAYRWYGKTGTCSAPDSGWVGWHVGFVERDGKTSFYALNTSGADFAATAARRSKLIREKLSRAGLIDANAPSPRVQMQARIDDAVRRFPGTVSLYAKNLDTGESYEIRADDRVRTASTIKLPIMAATFAAVAQGKARWDDRIPMRAEDKISGTGVIRELADGTALTLRDLVHMMMVVSDNTATNLVLDRISADFVNGQMDKLGFPQTRSLRKVLGSGAPGGHSRAGLQKEFEKYGLGVSTPREMVTLLEKIERGEVVSPEASREMLTILGRQQYKEGIGRRLPGSAVASKSGSLDRLRSDVGIVRYVGGRLAVAITVDDMLRTDYSPENAGSVLISDLTQVLLEGLSAPVAELSDMSGPEKVIELQARMEHVQGFYVDGPRLWVSWVDRTRHTGHLSEFNLNSGKLVRSVEVQQGERYHPGGIAGDAESIWVPVAEYKPSSSAWIQRRDRNTLELLSEFEVKDHIGCVAVAAGKLYGGNWDSREIYMWDEHGKLLSKHRNTAGTSYQDMKLVDGTLFASGLREGEGAVDILDPADFRLRRRVRAGKTSRSVLLTHEGMAVANDRIYLLPEDGDSRLFVFRIP